MRDFEIRPTSRDDADWVEQFTVEHSLAPYVVAHGESYYPSELPGFVAESDGERIGFVSYRIDRNEVEIVTLDTVRENIGVGTALIEAVVRETRAVGCERVWLITTNDNLRALGFYQKRGFELVAIHRNALERSRAIKPEIPKVGLDGIPMRDEIELEIRVDPASGPRY
jgi:ribosomal protein S18 acetylase RimI-like enzyme